MSAAMAVFVRRYAIATITVSPIRYAAIACATSVAAATTHAQAMSPVSTISAEVSTVASDTLLLSYAIYLSFE